MKIGSGVFNPGELRTQITLKSRSVTKAAGGFQRPGWVTVATVLAKWENVHGSEVWTADAAGAESPATVTIRALPGINTTWAVEKNGELYEIVSMDNIREYGEIVELKVRRLKEG